MKYIIVIGDGMADNPLPERGGRTPLEISETPHMDNLCRRSEAGTVRTVPAGLAPGSDTAILSIFGYDPRRFYAGRSPLEAAGVGVALSPGDVSYRCNMVTLEEGALPWAERRILSHSGGAVDGESASALLSALLAEPRFAALCRENSMTFTDTRSFRHIAVQKGVSIDGLHTSPPHEYLDEKLGRYLPAGCAAADGLCAMMALAYEILDRHPVNEARRAQGLRPANGIWFWAEGAAISLPSLPGRFGKAGLVVSAVPLVRGIGRLAGLEVVIVPGATGDLNTNYEGKADAVLDGLRSGADFALVHIEAPDECTHNGELDGKIEAIRRIDARCVARLKAGLDKVGEPYRLLILSDHKTLTATRGHDGDPVPYALYDSGRDTGWDRPYTERDCEQGEHIEAGHTLIERLFDEETR